MRAIYHSTKRNLGKCSVCVSEVREMIFYRWRRLATISLSCLAPLVIVCSSFASSKTSLKGTVTDSEGAAIRGAHVIVHWDQSGSRTGLKDNLGVKQDMTLETNQKGEFAVDLPPGFYDVFVSAPAFAPDSRKIRIKPEQTSTYRAKLKADPRVTRELGDQFPSK